MKKMIIISAFLVFTIGTIMTVSLLKNEACAGSKCRFKMVCGGNSNIKATVCAEDCNNSRTKENAKKWFKKKCSSASMPSNYHSGWRNCDVKL